jgi:crotonobetainyl-CoA:carnitine CoA-transferase CaiB-like acyl-CoA transferase
VPHLLAICNRARYRYGAGTARLGASAERTVSGVRDRDGWITIGAANQANWIKLTEALEAGTLRDDARFTSNACAHGQSSGVGCRSKRRFRQRSSAEWLRRLEDAGVPAGPVLDVVQMHADPQVQAREMVVEVPHSALGKVKTIGAAVKFSERRAACSA